MKATFVFSPSGAKDLRALAHADQLRILDAIERLATTEHGDVRPLQGEFKGSFRLRVGKWRVFFRISAPATCEVFRIDNRGQAY